MSDQRIDPEEYDRVIEATRLQIGKLEDEAARYEAERDRLREEGLRAIAAIDEAISHYNISEAKRIARAMYDRWRVSP
jgi:hypothetical protein